MKRAWRKLIVFVCVVVGGTLVFLYFKEFRGVKPVVSPPPYDIAKVIETNNEESSPLPEQKATDMPLRLPNGFRVEIFAKNLSGARVMAFDSKGNMWVSRRADGIVTKLTVVDGKVVEFHDIFRGLKNPHGLAFDRENPEILYIAEEHRIVRTRIDRDASLETVVSLPEGGRHNTRTLLYGADGRLYISIGSTCDVCHEKDDRIGTVMVVDVKDKRLLPYATGLRNSVFMAVDPLDGKLWATEMGRDHLGDLLPPDEVNRIESGKNYGWPICYGKNIHDTQFDKRIYVRAPCVEPFETPSAIDIPAHSAPLGLAFVPEEGWPESYWHDLFVAYHGSWNSSVPVGYKIVRLKRDAKGNFEGEEDFITGWLTKDNQALGRPVGLHTLPGGIIYISDDKAGVIYRVVYTHT